MKMVSEVPLKNSDKMSVVPASYKIDVRAITQSVKKNACECDAGNL